MNTATVNLTEMIAHRGYPARSAQRELRDPLMAEDAGHDVLEAVPSGRPIEGPQPRPDEIAEQQELLALALARIEALPSGLRDVMRLRILEERDTDDVCDELGITEDNLFVRLHRARKQLLS